MASIKKEGRYYKVYFRYGGKQFKRSTRSTSKKIAEDLRKKIENELAKGIFKIEDYSPNEQILLSDFIEEAIRYSQTNKKASTALREKRILHNFLNFCGDITLSSLKVKKIEEYKNYLLTSKHFMPSGVNIELRHLSTSFSVAVKYGYLSINPFKSVKKIKIPKYHPKFLTKEQAEKLLEITTNKSVYSYIYISLFTGTRAEEVVKLEWKDVDLENQILKVNGKGSKDRTIPISNALLTYLESIKEDEGPVCKGSNRPDQVSKNFRKYADLIGLNDYTFHHLRHTFASWLVQNGTNLKVVQELLGHENIDMTLRYAHLSPDNRFEAVNVIDKVLIKD